MSLANASPFAALAVPYVAPDGREVIIAVVKATFFRRKNGKLVLADSQSPVRIADAVRDPDAEQSSILYPSDVGLERRGTDIVVVGEAIAKSPVKAMDVAVKVRARTVSLRVHGARFYYRSLGQIAIGPAASFERKPISYENAYGGTSDDHGVVERRNPVGRGVARTSGELVDTPAPSIEHPAHPITSAGDKPEPVGFGAIASYWLPRAKHVGTYDDVWKQTRMPLLPLDFDSRYFNVAHPSLQIDEPLVAGDAISILGMREDGLFQVELPAFPVSVRAKRNDGQLFSGRPPVDLVLVEPGEGRVQLTARVVLPKGRGKTLLREVRVDIND
jgi:hypothetical protein